MSLSLDLGTSRMRALRVRGERLAARGCRALHAVLPDHVSQRRLLERLRVPFATCEGGLVIVGDAAAEFAPLFQAPLLPLFPDGRLPHDDPLARQVISILVDGLLTEPRGPGEFCSMVLPGAMLADGGSVGGPADPDSGIGFLSQLVRLRGYAPQVISAGLAAVLAELNDAGFTGVGLAMGAGSCELSLAHRGVELARGCVPRGGDWIDEQVRAEQGDATPWPAPEEDSLVRPASGRGRLLACLYRELLDSLLSAAAEEFAQLTVAAHLPQPMTLAACGGPVRAPGFVLLLEEAVREASLPVAVGTVRAVNCDYTVARGCLIHAELETAHARAA